MREAPGVEPQTVELANLPAELIQKIVEELLSPNLYGDGVGKKLG
mgnify:CR=1 FL=1